MCKLRIYAANAKSIDYVCDHVRELFPSWKEDFKKNNSCDEKDQYYISYCNEIQEFLDKCVLRDGKCIL